MTPDKHSLLAILALKELASPRRVKRQVDTISFRRAIWLLEKHNSGLCDVLSDKNLQEIEREYRCLGEVFWWRLLPYGLWTEGDGSVVLFDRNYCPIIRVQMAGGVTSVHPLEHIKFVDERWFYEDATAPYLDPETAPNIVGIAAVRTTAEEIEYRFHLSHLGYVEHDIWGTKWQLNRE